MSYIITIESFHQEKSVKAILPFPISRTLEMPHIFKNISLQIKRAAGQIKSFFSKKLQIFVQMTIQRIKAQFISPETSGEQVIDIIARGFSQCVALNKLSVQQLNIVLQKLKAFKKSIPFYEITNKWVAEDMISYVLEIRTKKNEGIPTGFEIYDDNGFLISKKKQASQLQPTQKTSVKFQEVKQTKRKNIKIEQELEQQIDEQTPLLKKKK